MNYIR